jgi:hypothetical protein
MPLFTVLVDLRGGTYVSQVRAGSAGQASLKWADCLEVGAMPGVGPAARRELIRQVRENDKPVRVNGLTGVWCQSHLLRGKLALVHIVSTG